MLPTNGGSHLPASSGRTSLRSRSGAPKKPARPAKKSRKALRAEALAMKAPEADPVQAEVLARVKSAVDGEKSQRAFEEQQLQNLENEILLQSMQVLRYATAFGEIDPESLEPPADWIAELGKVEAWKKFRLCKGAWASLREAPVGLKITTDAARSIIRSRSVQKIQPKALSITWISSEAPPKALLEQYPEVALPAVEEKD